MTISALPAAGVIAWAQQLLSSDSALSGYLTGGWYLGAAPTSVVVPCGVLNEPTAAQDLNTLYGNPWASDVSLQVSVFGPAADVSTILFPAAQRVYALLQRAQGGAQGTVTLSCVRQTNHLLAQPDLINGVQWYGFYQVFKVIAQ